MSENEIIELNVNHAVLHILDFTTRLTVLSQDELDLHDDHVYGYVLAHLLKIQNDTKRKTVAFNEESELGKAIRDYGQSKIGFLDLSDAISQRFIDFFTRHPDLQAFDVLVADYTRMMTPYLAILVLDNAMAWTHQVDNSTGEIRNLIIEHHAVLPSPSRRVGTYALINVKTGEINCCDTMKVEADKEPRILQNVLECSDAKSTDEVVKIVKKITKQVAEDYDESPTILLSKAKNFIKNNADVSSSLSPSELGAQVFEDKPEMKQAFDEMVEKAQLPKKVDLPQASAKKTSSKQKLRTDTGIEISFPVEYFSNPDYIEFINHPDGSITIELKHIGRIIPRQ